MYIIVDEYSSPQKPYYLIRIGNDYEISSDKNKALRINTEIKAKNILNSLPKILKRYMWNVILDIDNEYENENDNELLETNIMYDYDEFLSETDKTISRLSETLYMQQILIESYSTEHKKLKKLLSLIDKELVDIDHHIELNTFSASKGYKIIALRQKKLKQRRKIKDSIFIYEHFICTLDDQKLNNTIMSIKGLEGRKYAPKTQIYEQLKYI